MYQLPDDEVFVSGIYWLSVYPPVKKFNKKVTVSLQHCAFNDDSVLSFATAKCTQKALPYTFKSLPGGDFCRPWNGTIEVESFSAFAILAKIITRAIHLRLGYTLHSFYIPKRQRNQYDLHITVTQRKDLVTKIVSQIYKDLLAEEGPSVSMVKFENGCSSIQLDIPLESWMSSGWKLYPLSNPTLMKEDLDDYKGEHNSVPAFQIELKMTESRSLEYKVVFKGIEFPRECFLLLRRDPIEQEEAWPPSTDSDRSTVVQGTEPDGASVRVGECPEITKLRENLTLIIRTVTAGGSPQHFANKLVEKAFLPHRTAQQILNALGSTPDQQASKLMESVVAKIEHSERKNKLFMGFVDIFSCEPAYDDLVNKLRETDTTQ